MQPGDREIVQNVGVRGKRKIADRWEKDVYLVVDQPNKGIPVYLLKREHGRGRRRMLHRNLLLPFMSLPASKPDLLDTSIPTESIQPLPVDTTTSGDNTGQDDLADTSLKEVLQIQEMLDHRQPFSRISMLSHKEDRVTYLIKQQSLSVQECQTQHMV